MRDLTLHEIDDQLAEQLPTRELMGCHPNRSSGSTFVYNQGSFDSQNAGIALVQVQADGNNVIL
jgi:hypothetical protein